VVGVVDTSPTGSACDEQVRIARTEMKWRSQLWTSSIEFSSLHAVWTSL